MSALPPSACSTLADHVDAAALRWPDAEAVVFGNDRLTFAAFAERTVLLARGLHGLGVGPGDAVGLLMRNRAEMLAAMYATSRLGAVAVPFNSRLRARELAYLIPHADVRVLLTSDPLEGVVDFGSTLAEAVELASTPALEHVVMEGADTPDWMLAWPALLAAADGVSADAVLALQRRVAVRDTAMIMYTSGTTADPKGCRMSHETLVRCGHVFGRERFPMVAGDRHFNPLPLFHMATLLPFNGCLSVGATFVGMEHYEPGEALRVVERERCTVAFPAFDQIWAAMLAHPDFAATELSRIRLVNVNGIPERTGAMARQTPWLTQISPYGATEGGGIIALSHVDEPLEARIGTAGRPFAGIEVRIRDPETGAPVAPGVRGEITYRGWSLFDGYHKDPEATAAAFDADGFFCSGDLGTLDADGRLTYLGRLKDMLKVGGENVAAAEIEAVLDEHEVVAFAQVVAAPDARLDEVACAYVQLRPGADVSDDELIAHCSSRLASFKVPRYVRFVEEWPMSGTKIQKFRLRERIAEELAR